MPATKGLMAALAAAAVLIGGCGGGSDDDASKTARTNAEKKAQAKRKLKRARPVTPSTPGVRSFYRRPVVASALSGLKQDAGGGRVLSALLTPKGYRFQVAGNGRPANLTSRSPGYARFKRSDAPAASATYVRAASFPIAQLDPSVPQTLVSEAKARSKGKRFVPTSLSLAMVSAGHLQWRIAGVVSKRGVTYQANADGTGLRRFGAQGGTKAGKGKRRRQAAKPLPPRTPIPKAVVRKRLDEARQLERCITKAKGDRQKIRQCNDSVSK